MADVDTKSMSAPQAASTDIAEGGENGRKSQTNPRIQCSSVETTNNHSSIQSEKAQSPDTFLSQCPAPGPSPEPSGTITLKMQTAVLPLRLGESTVFLPVHVQMPTPAPAVQVSALAATPPSVLSSHGLVSLPLILEQQIFQQFNSQFFPQGAACTAPPPPLLQSNTLCQNSSVTFCQPSPREQKVVEEAAVEQDRIPFVPSPGFTAVSQDQFTTCNSFAQITCQMAGPKSPQAFAQGFLPSPPSLPISYPYTSLLAPLVPPPTLLVPFPVVVPLPIPLPIPIPIRTKDEGHEPKSTVSVGTQTCEGFCVRSNSLTHATESEGGALDLSASTGLTRLKHEVLSPQDSPLDLSVAVAFPGCRSRVQVEQQDIKQPVRDVQKSEQSLEAFQPLGYGQTLDSELLSGLNSREFDRRHKCVMDNLCGHEPKYDARNYEIVSTSQTAKVLVDSIPTILSGKLKDFAGMPDNTFRCQQDTELGILVGHHCSASRNPQGEAGHLIDSRKGISRNRSVKFKKVSSQEIHILPIKKQRFTTFFHGE